MQIDWFTLVAQIVNFLILLALLKRLLYNRIIAAMDRREQEIAGRLKEAEKKKDEAHEEKQRFQKRHEQLETRRNKVLSQARDEAEQRKKELLVEAREEVEATRRHWQESLSREQQEFARQLRRRGTQQVVAVSRKVLADLSDRDLEAQIARTFHARLESLGEDQWDQLQEATVKDARLTIASTFELPKETRQSIQEILTSRLEQVSPTFRTSDRVVCGIALEAGGFQLAWNADSYLEDLERELVDLVEDRARGSGEAGDGRSERSDEQKQTGGQRESGTAGEEAGAQPKKDEESS